MCEPTTRVAHYAMGRRRPGQVPGPRQRGRRQARQLGFNTRLPEHNSTRSSSGAQHGRAVITEPLLIRGHAIRAALRETRPGAAPRGDYAALTAAGWSGTRVGSSRTESRRAREDIRGSGASRRVPEAVDLLLGRPRPRAERWSTPRRAPARAVGPGSARKWIVRRDRCGPAAAVDPRACSTDGGRRAGWRPRQGRSRRPRCSHARGSAVEHVARRYRRALRAGKLNAGCGVGSNVARRFEPPSKRSGWEGASTAADTRLRENGSPLDGSIRPSRRRSGHPRPQARCLRSALLRAADIPALLTSGKLLANALRTAPTPLRSAPTRARECGDCGHWQLRCGGASAMVPASYRTTEGSPETAALPPLAPPARPGRRPSRSRDRCNAELLQHGRSRMRCGVWILSQRRFRSARNWPRRPARSLIGVRLDLGCRSTCWSSPRSGAVPRGGAGGPGAGRSGGRRGHRHRCDGAGISLGSRLPRAPQLLPRRGPVLGGRPGRAACRRHREGSSPRGIPAGLDVSPPARRRAIRPARLSCLDPGPTAGRGSGTESPRLLLHSNKRAWR